MKSLWLLLLVSLLSGCINAHLSKVEVEPGFDWETLKRDEIVLTPLMDLRDEPIRSAQPFFTDAQRVQYSESFKQVFFKYRKDIRVYGAGGAYEKISAIPNLEALSRKVFAKVALTDVEIASLQSSSQDIRYVYFFAIPRESLSRNFEKVVRDLTVDYSWQSYRNFDVQLALYDLREKKVQWVGTSSQHPRTTNDIIVKKPLRKKGSLPLIQFEMPMVVYNGSEEGKYPPYPPREPYFSGSFDDFALSLPLQPSEDKLIQYEYFTYHRFEAVLRDSELGRATQLHGGFAYSSVIHNSYRLGFELGFPLMTPHYEMNGLKYKMNSTYFGLTTDYEVQLSEKWRLMAGVIWGTEIFAIYDEAKNEQAKLNKTTTTTEEDDNSDSDSPTDHDGTVFAWPRVKIMYGNKSGFFVGAGAGYRAYKGIDEALLKTFLPSPWTFELNVGVAVKGY